MHRLDKTEAGWQSFLRTLVPQDCSRRQLMHMARRCQIERPVCETFGLADDTLVMAHAARTQLYWMTLQKVLLALKDMDVLVIKGPPLSIRIFGRDDFRQSSDVDLWVHPKDLGRAAAALQTLGYMPQKVVRPWATNQQLFVPQNPLFLAVEIHWKLTQPPFLAPDFESAWNMRSTESWHQLTFHTLGDTHCWIGLIFHAFQHVWAIKPWLDLAAADTLSVNPSVIRQYGLCRIDRFVRDVVRGNASYQAACLRAVLRHLLLSDEGGKLVMGLNSPVEAALGVVSRSLSVFMLDGMRYPIKSFAFYIFLACDIIKHKLNGMLLIK